MLNIKNIQNASSGSSGIFRPERYLVWLLAISLLAAASCKKTDKYAELVNDQPYIVMTSFGLYGTGLPTYSGYQTNFLIGDTVVLLGKFFMDKPGFHILFGNEAAKIAFHAQVNAAPDSMNQYTGKPEKLDYVKFAITRGMGVGTKVPVTITANGMTIQGPSVSIQQFKGVLGKTDTTLFVDSITNWVPADVNTYMSNSLPLSLNTSISRDGVICLNNLTDLFILQNGTFVRFMGTGDQFTDHGTSFSINRLLGSVISIAGDSLAFSAEVNENAPDAASSFIFRLCKMDLATKTITTINRTALLKGIPAANGALGPFKGDASRANLIASNLKTDINGSLYFINYFAPASTDFNATAFYNNGIGTVQPIYDPHLFGNLYRIETSGNLTSLAAQSGVFTPSNYTLPGYPSQQLTDYLVTVDGSTGLFCDKVNPTSFLPSFTEIDLHQDLPLLSTGYIVNYKFYSYDTSSITGIASGADAFSLNFNNNYYLTTFQFLQDGELLLSRGTSIAAFNLLSKTYYCYAGTESGMGGNYLPGYNNTTGPAKHVNFGNPQFIGIDKNGVIYYFTSPVDYSQGLSFYRLYPKK